MTETIEAIFDGTVFRPEQKVELKPNTRVEIMVTLKNKSEKSAPFRVRSKHLGSRENLNYDKTSELIDKIEGIEK